MSATFWKAQERRFTKVVFGEKDALCGVIMECVGVPHCNMYERNFRPTRRRASPGSQIVARWSPTKWLMKCEQDEVSISGTSMAELVSPSALGAFDALFWVVGIA
jgi:hypothetical protein